MEETLKDFLEGSLKELPEEYLYLFLEKNLKHSEILKRIPPDFLRKPCYHSSRVSYKKQTLEELMKVCLKKIRWNSWKNL